MRILHLASELTPFAKTGGLGDVMAALPVAQAAVGDDVTVALPAYGHVDWERLGARRRLADLSVMLGGQAQQVSILTLTVDGVRVLLVDHPSFRLRHGVYGDQHGEFADNPWRFALYGKAALAAAEALLLWPDVVHAHDWHTGAALVHARHSGLRRPGTVFTIHNLAYQGRVPAALTEQLGLPWSGYTPEGFELWGELCLLKAGLWAADVITTVSPRYAQEIQTPQFGEGLDGYLRAHADRLLGIVNGVDYRIWDPAIDSRLPARYDAAHPQGKATCKATLQRALGLPIAADVPLFAVVSRLTGQKGIDLIADALPAFANRRLQLVVVGAGDKGLLERIERARPFDVVTRFAVDEDLAHRVYAAADFFLMPSRFEPCGLGQLYAMVYGALPIVSPVGGLLDTVIDAAQPGGCGVVLDGVSAPGLERGIERALALFADRARLESLRAIAMNRRFPWSEAATRYRTLYGDTLSSATL